MADEQLSIILVTAPSPEIVKVPADRVTPTYWACVMQETTDVSEAGSCKCYTPGGIPRCDLCGLTPSSGRRPGAAG